MAKETSVKVEATRAAQQPTENALSPLVDIYERPDEVLLVVEVPGAAKDTVSVQVDKGVLTLEAASTVGPPDGTFSRTYIGFEGGQYYRAFALSDEIDRERITAVSENGVVSIHLPKAPQAKSRKIEIKTME